MIFWLEDALFSAQALRDIDRLALLRNLATRRHTAIISAAPDDLPAQRNRTAFEHWLAALSENLRSEVQLLVERAGLIASNLVTRGGARINVTVQAVEDEDATSWNVDLKTGIRVAALPLRILVENGINDAAFLRRIMPPAWRRRLRDWEQSGAMLFEHGGGLSDMQNMVEHFTDAQWRMLRVVVWDHDGKEATKPGGDSAKLQAAINDAGMATRGHMLARRKQENYLPVEALEAIDAGIGSPRQHARDGREFEDRHKRYKNRFGDALQWHDDWFRRDESWPEMIGLAEKIAAAM